MGVLHAALLVFIVHLLYDVSIPLDIEIQLHTLVFTMYKETLGFPSIGEL